MTDEQVEAVKERNGALWIADVWQDGMCVASIGATNRHDALRGIAHYARQYEQNGPVELRLTFVHNAMGGTTMTNEQLDFLAHVHATMQDWADRIEGEWSSYPPTGMSYLRELGRFVAARGEHDGQLTMTDKEAHAEAHERLAQKWRHYLAEQKELARRSAR